VCLPIPTHIDLPPQELEAELSALQVEECPRPPTSVAHAGGPASTGPALRGGAQGSGSFSNPADGRGAGPAGNGMRGSGGLGGGDVGPYSGGPPGGGMGGPPQPSRGSWAAAPPPVGARAHGFLMPGPPRSPVRQMINTTFKCC
jgi:hypothetical protein